MAEVAYRFKILLLGDAAVGKTTLVSRYVRDAFRKEYKMTIGVDVMAKDVLVDETLTTLSIWDIAGQERFRSFRDVFYRGSRGALVVFDLTRYSTFKNLQDWIDDLYRFTGEVPVIIIGNKADLSEMRMVKKEEAESYAMNLGHVYEETSAKTGQNVNSVFGRLTKSIMEGLVKKRS